MKNQKKLFGNVGGNQFRLLTEGLDVTVKGPDGLELVKEGLKKVFTSGGDKISYNRLTNVGMGYIKDVTEAAKCALREAKDMADDFGYQDDASNKRFVKTDTVDEILSRASNEFQIAKRLIDLASKNGGKDSMSSVNKTFADEVFTLAKQLLTMHGK